MWSGTWSVALTRIGFWTLIYETLDWGRSGMLVSMLEKLSWFRLTGLITLVLLMWKWIGLFLRKNHLLRCWGWLPLLNWIGALTFSLLLKLPPSFFVLRLLCIYKSIIPWLLLVDVTWNCWISYKNWYVGLLVLYLRPLENPWLLVEM